MHKRKRDELRSAIGKIAWGYIFLHLHFNIGNVDILADWIGYVLFVSALPAIGEEEESANLLRPLGILLGALTGISWGNDFLMEGYLNLDVLNIIESVVSLYFHYQLLTNLATVARNHECSQEKKILVLRTVKTVLTTFFAVIIPLQLENVVLYGLLVILLIVTFWICFVLFSFKNEVMAK